MYSIIDKCYGILLHDCVNTITKEKLALLYSIMELDECEYLRDDPDDDSSPLMSMKDFKSLWNEVSEGQPYLWSSYSGDGDPPVVIGFCLRSIPAFEVSINIDFFQPTEREVDDAEYKFRQLFQTCKNKEKILELIASHKPSILFTHSTS